MNKEIETLNININTQKMFIHYNGKSYDVEQLVERKEKLEEAIRDLFANHVEFVAEEDKCYFKIKNSKGKEKSFTSKTFEDYWKEVFGK